MPTQEGEGAAVAAAVAGPPGRHHLPSHPLPSRWIRNARPPPPPLPLDPAEGGHRPCPPPPHPPGGRVTPPATVEPSRGLLARETRRGAERRRRPLSLAKGKSRRRRRVDRWLPLPGPSRTAAHRVKDAAGQGEGAAAEALAAKGRAPPAGGRVPWRSTPPWVGGTRWRASSAEERRRKRRKGKMHNGEDERWRRERLRGREKDRGKMRR
uniref:Uncharacterized protein n=1 Tax=Oryza meridionalis TaxID=40149 RepID=A0A0E0DRZ5_9ORYZ